MERTGTKKQTDNREDKGITDDSDIIYDTRDWGFGLDVIQVSFYT
jgi:hypothetical protein